MNKVYKIILDILITIAILIILILIIIIGSGLKNNYSYESKNNIENKLEELLEEEPQTPQEIVIEFLKDNYKFIITNILLIIIIIKIDKLKKI